MLFAFSLYSLGFQLNGLELNNFLRELLLKCFNSLFTRFSYQTIPFFQFELQVIILLFKLLQIFEMIILNFLKRLYMLFKQLPFYLSLVKLCFFFLEFISQSVYSLFISFLFLLFLLEQFFQICYLLSEFILLRDTT